MSQRTRQVLGEPANLMDLLLAPQPPQSGGRPLRVSPYQFLKIWESARSVLLVIRKPQLPDPILLEVLRLEARLLRKLFRLALQERTLAEGNRAGTRGDRGRTAIRQIELERRRLGRELHTGVGQALAAIRLQLEILATEWPLPPPSVRQALANIGILSGQALEQVRSVSQKLHPPDWQRFTLESALHQLWQISGVPERFEADFQVDSLPEQPIPEVKAIVYRALQESLSNLVRHSKATRIDVRLLAHGDRVVLTVADNGVGFDAAALWNSPASLSDGIGLRAIREQVEEFGGKFDIESSPLGTKLIISVTLAPAE